MGVDERQSGGPPVPRPPLTFEQASAWILNYHGFGYWAVEVRASGEFIGFTGLGTVDEEMPFTGVELGWRLARPARGHGYATEAAPAAMEYGFGAMGCRRSSPSPWQRTCARGR